MNPLTEEQFKAALPTQVRKNVSQDLIDQVNTTLSDPDMFEVYRDNLLSYGKVMADGRFKISQYLSAVKYVSHKLMGCSNIDAYSRTFPDKINRFQMNGVSNKDIASYVTAYNKSKLVNLIMEQTIIPSWVLNQDMHQKALNVQAELMMSAKSEKVRSDAANSILTHLKQPETQKFEMDVNVKEDSSIAALRDATMALVRQQQGQIQGGDMSAKEMAESKLIIDGEYEETDNG